MKALVLCAGFGTRLRPLTDTTPKPMIDVGGEPLLAHHLRQLAAAGVRDVAVNLHHLPGAVVDGIGREAYGVAVRYHVEAELLGSAGALHGFPGFFDEPFFVVYGDVFHEIDLAALAAFHSRAGAVLTIATTTAEDPTTKGVVVAGAGGRVTEFVEKPQSAPHDAAVNAGVYVCAPDVAKAIPPGTSDFGRDLIPALVRAGAGVYALSTPAVVVDIGTFDGLEQARTLAARRR